MISFEGKEEEREEEKEDEREEGGRCKSRSASLSKRSSNCSLLPPTVRGKKSSKSSILVFSVFLLFFNFIFLLSKADCCESKLKN